MMYSRLPTWRMAYDVQQVAHMAYDVQQGAHMGGCSLVPGDMPFIVLFVCLFVTIK